ncbi:hypothetical protein [Methylomagnum sp.]
MKLKHIAATSALTVICLSGPNAHAHPGWVSGTSNLTLTNAVPASVTDPADPNKVTNNTSPTTSSAPSRGYLEDGVRIGHGCSNEAGQYEPGSAAVNAVSWIWPTGENANDPAPMSTGCDVGGANCTGSSTQPSVATIPNSSQKPNYNNADWAPGTATAANLADHLCVATSATDATCASKVASLAKNFTAQGNPAYFKTFQPHKRAPGFYAKGRKMKDAEIAAFSANYGVPYASAAQISYVNNTATPTIPYVFSSTSCARKLVVRPAGADICKIRNTKVIDHAHDQNLWFGGPTSKFADGHGVHENFWMGYNLLVRNTKVNPYPATCKDQVYGDYDLVVMPSAKEIDDNLGFPGWAKGK